MRERRMRGGLTQEKREGCGASRIVESGKPTAKGLRARGAEVACGSFDGSIVASPFGFSVTVDRLWWRDVGTAHAWVLVANKGPPERAVCELFSEL